MGLCLGWLVHGGGGLFHFPLICTKDIVYFSVVPDQPQILVGIVTYNSVAHIEACLRSIAAQSHPAHSIHIWDNASSDATIQVVQKLLPNIPGLPPTTLHQSPTNLGFGGAHNRILASAESDLYLLLNPDAVLDPEFFSHALQALQQQGVASVNGLVQYAAIPGQPPVIYSLGHVMFRDRRIEDLGIGIPTAEFPVQGRALFGTNGAAALLDRAALRDVSYPEGPFDGAYFLYGEDDDLNWRLALAGHRSWSEPRAVVWHDAGASGGFSQAPARRNALANRWLTIVKNDHVLLFLRDAFWVFSLEMLYYFMRLLRRPRFAIDLLGALARFVSLLPHALRRRRQTPVRVTLRQESALLESGMLPRLRELFYRYSGRRRQRSLWTRTESTSPSPAP